MLAARGRKPQWFRHPFLHAGRDAKTRAHLADFLDKHGYRVAPVTIDNSEWIFASAYLKLLERQDDERAARLRAEYVDYMGAKFAYFEDQSQALLGRQPAQILLLHANVLNADALPELLEKIGERGYEFISLDEAMKDSAYALEDGYFGPAGITWLHRWALSQKKPASFYAGEPKVSQEVLDIAGIESE